MALPRYYIKRRLNNLSKRIQKGKSLKINPNSNTLFKNKTNREVSAELEC